MQKRIAIDMMQRTVELNSTVSRIVSLVPSQTELFVDLGLQSKLVGITKFCIHPSYLRREVTSVGGPKKLDVAKIRELNPDLIVANKEENIQHEIELLATEFPVWISDVYTLEDSIQMIQMLGHITNTQDVANTICSNIQQAFQSLVIPKHTLSVLYLIWKDPFMGVGKTTFIDDMLTRLGFQNAIQTERYPTINQLEMQPDLVFLSSEPYPFSEKHLSEVQSMFPQSRLFLVDGEYFTWYGSRMQDSPKYFQKLLNFIDNE